MIVKTHKQLTLISLLLGIQSLFLVACDSKSASVQIEADQLTVPVPEDIRQVAALGTLPVRFQVKVNGDIAREVPVTFPVAEAITETVNIPEAQQSNIEVAWLVLTGGRKVVLADFDTRVSADQSVLQISNYRSEVADGLRFDEDEDGLSNLQEARENRNILSQYDAEVPLRTDFGGGVFFTVLNDGIDENISGDPVEPESDTTFSLRHDGTNLIVYVCGQDATLEGDSGEQFWDDDVVYIYLDGNNSDNPSYDSVDDMQLAFVRSTQELRIPKGNANPFCTAGTCIPPAIYPNFNTTCQYELEVTLPLAELNMAIDTPIGFDLEITDDDNGGQRDSSRGWIGYNDRSDQNPSTFGTIILRP